MSGGTLPVTGAGTLTIAGLALSSATTVMLALAIALVGVGLVALSIRGGWRRGKTYDQP